MIYAINVKYTLNLRNLKIFIPNMKKKVCKNIINTTNFYLSE